MHIQFLLSLLTNEINVLFITKNVIGNAYLIKNILYIYVHIIFQQLQELPIVDRSPRSFQSVSNVIVFLYYGFTYLIIKYEILRKLGTNV